MFTSISQDLNTIIELASTIKGSLSDEETFSCDECCVFRSCLACACFDEVKEHCGKYNARPPARVIVFGCEGFEDIELENSQDGVTFRDGATKEPVSTLPTLGYEDNIPF